MKRKSKAKVHPKQDYWNEEHEAIDMALDIVDGYFNKPTEIAADSSDDLIELEDTKGERLAAFSAILSHLLATSQSNANK